MQMVTFTVTISHVSGKTVNDRMPELFRGCGYGIRYAAMKTAE
jgi:hypothetical protein